MLKLKDHCLLVEKLQIKIKPDAMQKVAWDKPAPKTNLFGKDGNCK
jgi:hypothetical protein